MRTEDAETIPHRKKKDSNKSKADARSDHEHYYAMDVTHFYNVNKHKLVFTKREPVCIFCGKRPRLSRVRKETLEVYTEKTVYVRWGL